VKNPKSSQAQGSRFIILSVKTKINKQITES